MAAAPSPRIPALETSTGVAAPPAEGPHSPATRALTLEDLPDDCLRLILAKAGQMTPGKVRSKGLRRATVAWEFRWYKTPTLSHSLIDTPHFVFFSSPSFIPFITQPYTAKGLVGRYLLNIGTCELGPVDLLLVSAGVQGGALAVGDCALTSTTKVVVSLYLRLRHLLILLFTCFCPTI
jgi:hypothetical protein